MLRGITKEAYHYFRLGFVDSPDWDDSHLRDRISIPYITSTGIVGLKYRSIYDKEPKYLYHNGFYGKRIFNPGALTSSDRRIYVCEGEIDCITLSQLGVPSVAIPGATSFDPVLSRAFRNRPVVVVADGDDNGEGKKMAETILKYVDCASMVIMDGHDVNSYYNLYGEKKLLERIGWQ